MKAPLEQSNTTGAKSGSAVRQAKLAGEVGVRRKPSHGIPGETRILT